MDILYTKMKILGMANVTLQPVHASLFSDCEMFNVSCDCLSLNLKSLRNTCNIDRKYVEDITKSKIFICTCKCLDTKQRGYIMFYNYYSQGPQNDFYLEGSEKIRKNF